MLRWLCDCLRGMAKAALIQKTVLSRPVFM